MDLRPLYRPRPAESRKGDYGRVLVVGGSERYSGAPAFNALAALRTGADLVTVLAPRRAADIVAGFAPDLITHPCTTTGPDPILVEELSASADALVVGGGVERSDRAHASIREIVRANAKPIVLDAEALHAIADHEALLKGKRALLTPHGGEYAVLAGEPWPSEPDARAEAARRLARRYHATVIVKGRFETLSDGDAVHVDEAGSPYLTKGGYGDLIAGAAGTYLARGASPLDAARAAAWLVGTAGERAAADLGESTLASDALARIPSVLGSILR